MRGVDIYDLKGNLFFAGNCGHKKARTGGQVVLR